MREFPDGLKTYEDFTPEEQRQIDNDMDVEMFINSAQRLIENGQALRVRLAWLDHILPHMPKSMRAA